MPVAERVRVFVASPGDVTAEREQLRRVVAELNATLGERFALSIDLLGWETHAHPGMGRPQGLINDQIGSYDVFIGMMWRRFGSPTGTAGSGTEEEFRSAYDSWQKTGRPKILFYFSEAPAPPPRSREEATQAMRVTDFRAELESRGLVWTYGESTSFQDVVRPHLHRLLMAEFVRQSSGSGVATGEPAPAEAPDLWQACLRYAGNPEIRSLRYVGFRLARKEPPSLDILEVFEPLDVEPRTRRAISTEASSADGQGARRGGEGLWSQGLWQTSSGPPVPFPTMFGSHRSLIVLGDPGSGKTTLLRWLAVVAAQGPEAMSRALGTTERVLPLPVSIGRLRQIGRSMVGAAVANVLARYFFDRSVGEEAALLEFFHARLEAGDALILLDGLDEVDAAERPAVQGWLEAFAARYPKNRYVATSRIVGFTGFQLPGGVEIVVRPFDDKQVERYVTSFSRRYQEWETGADMPATADEHSKELLSALDRNPRLKALARNPFLLSGMALIHRAEGRLPRYRVQAYELFARALCETWSTARRLVGEGPEQEIPYEEEGLPILGQLAYRMHEKWPSGVAPESFVVDTLADLLVDLRGIDRRAARRVAKRFLGRAAEDVQVLLERGAGEWGFLHLTFQEFFAAAGLHATEEFEAAAKERLFDTRWEEVIRLGVGYQALVQKRPLAARRFVEAVFRTRLTDENAWITRVLRKQVPLAGLLATEAGDAIPVDLQEEIGRALSAWILDMPKVVTTPVLREIAPSEFREIVASHLEAVLRGDHDNFLRLVAARALGELNARQAVPALMAALPDLNSQVRLHAALALGEIRAEAAVPDLARLLCDPDLMVPLAAAEALGRIGSDTAIEPLVDVLQRTEAGTHLKTYAARALARLRPALAAEILEETRKHADPAIRASAVRALSALGGLATVSITSSLLDVNATVRWNAARASADLGSAAPVADLIRALRDVDERVRASAAEALGNLRALAALGPLQALTVDSDPKVRGDVAEALGRLGSEESFETLSSCLQDPVDEVRSAAALALGQIRAAGATLLLLRALDDRAPAVRAAAILALGDLGCEDAMERILSFLGDEPSLNVHGGSPSHLVAPIHRPDRHLRACALQSLSRFSHPSASRAAVKALDDGDPEVVRAAIRAFRRLRTGFPLEQLVRMAEAEMGSRLHDDRWYNRQVALEVLWGVAEARP